MLCEEGEPLAWGRSTGWHAMLGASLYHRVDVYVVLHAMFCTSLYSYKATYLPSFSISCICLSGEDGVPCNKWKKEKHMQYWQAMVPARKGRAEPKK